MERYGTIIYLYLFISIDLIIVFIVSISNSIIMMVVNCSFDGAGPQHADSCADR
jgi:hypothetical protein